MAIITSVYVQKFCGVKCCNFIAVDMEFIWHSGKKVELEILAFCYVHYV
jgi:hypothetical protein